MSEGSAAQADARAGETEAQMTDEERFSLLVSVMGQIPGFRSAMHAFRTMSR